MFSYVACMLLFICVNFLGYRKRLKGKSLEAIKYQVLEIPSNNKR